MTDSVFKNDLEFQLSLRFYIIRKQKLSRLPSDICFHRTIKFLSVVSNKLLNEWERGGERERESGREGVSE